ATVIGTAGDRERSGSNLLQCAEADDREVHDHGIAAAERQGAVISDRATAERTGGAAVANLQRARIDRGGTVIICASQDNGSGPELLQFAGAGDVRADGTIVAAAGRGDAVIYDGACSQRSRGAASTAVQMS